MLADTRKYHELLEDNLRLFRPSDAVFRVALLSNASIFPLRELLEHALRERGVNAVVEVGEYDGIVQESSRCREHDAVFIFYELAGIVDNLPFSLHDLDEARAEQLVGKARQELSATFDHLADTRLVVINLLTALPFSSSRVEPTALDRIAEAVNVFIRERAPRGAKFVDLAKVLAKQSLPAAIDLRLFLSSRVLYSIAFLRAYAQHVAPVASVSAGRYKKVLVLDCDNTLWKGVVGEDGVDGIEMFVEIQSMVVQLAKAGVLVCLSSRNNLEDVEAVFARRADMILKDEHVVIKAVDWSEKADAIERMAAALNLGLDSFVFVDDSDVELDIVRRRLPAVTAVKVPATYPSYLWLFQDVAALFHREQTTAEDRGRTAQYRTEFERQAHGRRFERTAEFLASLDLKIRLRIDDAAIVPRLAQLTQKTNQFNLTTVRMTEAEVAAAHASPERTVIGIDVSDRFGAYGTTGLVILRRQGQVAEIENFLLSCRVLGRGVELKTFDAVAELLRAQGVTSVIGSYRAGARNQQVRDFYQQLGFDTIEADATATRYELALARYRPSSADHIAVAHA